MSEPSGSDVYLDARAVRRRYGGRSDMALYRWLRDPHLGFPSPIYINKYRIGDLVTCWTGSAHGPRASLTPLNPEQH